jgi:hypothetical protein
MDEEAEDSPFASEPVSAETRHAQMADGLFHRFQDVVKSMERRNAFLWDAPGAEADLGWMEGRGSADRPGPDR